MPRRNRKKRAAPSPGHKRRRRNMFGKRFTRPGSAPGTLEAREGVGGEPGYLRVIHYTPDKVEEAEVDSLQEALASLGEPGVTWVDIAGHHDVAGLRALGERLGLHPLALEDVLNHGQRPKVEEHTDHAFVVLKQMRIAEGEGLVAEQVSLFFGSNYVLTVQEVQGDVWEPVRERIRTGGGGRIRKAGADYLAYALIDAVVDHFFPVLETYGDRLDDLQHELFDEPRQETLERLHQVNRELILLRRAAWPHREVANALERTESGLVRKETKPFLRDCYDHTIQILDILESYRDLAGGLMDLYLSSVSNRMNEVMKVLTIIGTIFIPMTFLAGIYGMNFDPDASPLSMPELRWYWSYPVFWSVMMAMAGGMIYYFKRKGWW